MDRYKVADYYNAKTVTYEELRADLYENTTIEKINLDGCTKLTNQQLNTILGSMPQLKYVTLKDCTNLTTIDFVAESHKIENADGTNSYTYTNPKCTKLIELDLRKTNVTDMTPLNNYAMDLKVLRVSDGRDFINIANTISRLRTNSDYQYWYGNKDRKLRWVSL